MAATIADDQSKRLGHTLRPLVRAHTAIEFQLAWLIDQNRDQPEMIGLEASASFCGASIGAAHPPLAVRRQRALPNEVEVLEKFKWTDGSAFRVEEDFPVQSSQVRTVLLNVSDHTEPGAPSSLRFVEVSTSRRRRGKAEGRAGGRCFRHAAG